MGKKGHLTFQKGHLIFGGGSTHPLRYTTDTGVSTKFYLNQSHYFGNILINCKDVQSQEIFHFEI